MKRQLFALILAVAQAPCLCFAQAGTGPTSDLGWPRRIASDEGTLIYYQPQIEAWIEYKNLAAKVAFSLTPHGGKPVLGVADVIAGTVVDPGSHTVFIRDIGATEVRFLSLPASESQAMEKLFRSLLPPGGEPISRERVMADLEGSKVEAKTVAVKNDPPAIFHSADPAILLCVPGDPVLVPIENTDLEFVVNANWEVFFEKATKRYWLLAEHQWVESQDLKGPWTSAATLPNDMAKLPADQNFDDVKKMIPPPPHSDAAPQVFFSSVPAELILFKGAPAYALIPGTQIQYASNTENDVFLDGATQQYYVLLSGRWFRSKALEGPWTYAGKDLPAEFKKIPPDSPKARVLASVPGTVNASDAVMLAQIPQMAVVIKAEAEARVNQQGVHYSGQPDFKPIESTALEYGANTQDKVVKSGDLYYLCFQGVWFMSTKPEGPWKTADSIPQEIYTIPPSSPLYNVTYVTQSNATETTVESSTTDGYLGMYAVDSGVGVTITYGTGWYYPPYYYWGAGMMYPYYWTWPATYGAGYVYNPVTGGFLGGRVVYGPYGAVGSAAWYNPATGRYGRAASVQGWYGGRTAGGAYNPWTGGYGATSQGHSAYAQWGQSVATRGDQWARTGHVTTANGTAFGYRSSNGAGVGVRGSNGAVLKTNNSTYAGNDGNVYRKDSSGNWSKYNNGAWNPVNSGAAQNRQNSSRSNRESIQPQTLQSLNRSDAARQRGQAQTQQFQRSGGYRSGGGGGFRGRR